MTCARKCLIIVSVPLICLKSVCLGWHKVSCWDFNLLTRPSAAVVGSHIGGIKWEAAQHVRPSTCTLANNTITNLCLTHIPIQLHHNHKQIFFQEDSAQMFSSATEQNVGHCFFPCRSDVKWLSTARCSRPWLPFYCSMSLLWCYQWKWIGRQLIYNNPSPCTPVCWSSGSLWCSLIHSSCTLSLTGPN